MKMLGKGKRMKLSEQFTSSEKVKRTGLTSERG